MFVALERKFKYLVQILKLRSKGQCTIYENELYELKYSFLEDTVENVTCVSPCKAKKNFQTSQFEVNGLFCNFIYTITFAPIVLLGNMLQNTCKIIGYKKNMVYNFLRLCGGGGGCGAGRGGGGEVGLRNMKSRFDGQTAISHI